MKTISLTPTPSYVGGARQTDDDPEGFGQSPAPPTTVMGTTPAASLPPTPASGAVSSFSLDTIAVLKSV
jgi:hypothetical protein